MSSIEESVAILLATYNGEKYILKQLESIKEQTYTHFVCYIHDDGSTDETIEIIRAFCMGDYRFKLIDGPRCGGAKDNFFFLMNCIDDEKYIMFCDQDDYWFQEKIAVCLDAMQKNEKKNEPVCVYSDLEVVDEDLNTICRSFYTYSGKRPLKNDFTSLIMNNVVVGCTMMINRPLLNISLKRADHQLIYMHDWWLALIASASGKMIYIDRPLILYRQHTDNSVGAVPKKRYVQMMLDFLNYKNYMHNKERIQRSINFSKALDLIEINCKYTKLNRKMANIQSHNWLYRACFFIKNGLIPLNRIGKILWL